MKKKLGAYLAPSQFTVETYPNRTIYWGWRFFFFLSVITVIIHVATQIFFFLLVLTNVKIHLEATEISSLLLTTTQALTLEIASARRSRYETVEGSQKNGVLF